MEPAQTQARGLRSSPSNVSTLTSLAPSMSSARSIKKINAQSSTSRRSSRLNGGRVPQIVKRLDVHHGKGKSVASTSSDDDRPLLKRAIRVLRSPSPKQRKIQNHGPEVLREISRQRQLPVDQGSQTRRQSDIDWLLQFFDSLELPQQILEEMIDAGFKEFTVLHMVGAFDTKAKLTAYLDRILRLTYLERDTIADIMMEYRKQLVQDLKREE